MKTPFQRLPDTLPADPMPLAETWLQQAWDEQVQPNPNAMVLATVNSVGQPSARVVLCKEIVPNPGYVVFYTSYLSHKGRELTSNPRAAVVFHWDTLHRQLRIEGTVVRSPPAESDDYFAVRPWQSQVGAWASRQSEPAGSRSHLLDELRATARRLDAPDPTGGDALDPVPELVIPRPAHWGGFRLWAEAVEFWVEGEFRIHDRARWTRALHPDGAGHCRPGAWRHIRLQP
jgi:pyridoxamine 5'-phosphate oxidase